MCTFDINDLCKYIKWNDCSMLLCEYCRACEYCFLLYYICYTGHWIVPTVLLVLSPVQTVARTLSINRWDTQTDREKRDIEVLSWEAMTFLFGISVVSIQTKCFRLKWESRFLPHTVYNFTFWYCSKEQLGQCTYHSDKCSSTFNLHIQGFQFKLLWTRRLYLL